MGENSVRSVERAIDILYCLAEGEKGLVEISRQVKLGKATVHRQLSALINKGIVAQNPVNSAYTLGSGFFHMLYKFLKTYDSLIDVAYESMYRLNKLSNETVMLHVPKGTERLCIAEIKSNQEISYTAGVGVSVPIHVGSAGKVLLGYMSEIVREHIFRDLELIPLTGNTITDINLLREAVTDTANKGYAISIGERTVGAVGISVPILVGKQAVAVLSILGPGFRFDVDQMLNCLLPMQAEANVIGKKLGNEIDRK